MSATDDLLTAFELHDPDRIRAALAAGASPTAAIRGKPPIDWLIEMYLRSPRLPTCVGVMLEAGAVLGDPMLKSILLDDPEGLDAVLTASPERLVRPMSLVCAFTSLRGVSPLHVAAEYGAATCARALIAAGADVDARATIDAEGLGGQTPLFHTVNSILNHGRPVMELLLDAGATPDIRLMGLRWGEGFDWETTVFDVSPISYAQCGLYSQFHRREADVYGVIATLYERRHGRPAPVANVPNRYLAPKA